MTKILAIDDKKDNLIVISALLKNLISQCVVITAQTGALGIKKAEDEQPDVILLDVRMPEMNGYDVCRYLKSNEGTRHIPVIMLTAVEKTSSNRVRGLESGADAFMTKPIDETELIAQVKVALRIKAAEDQLRKEKAALESVVEERTRELSKSERRFRTLVENSLTGISIIQDNIVVYQNPEQENLFGPLPRTPKFIDINGIHPDDVKKVEDFYSRVVSREERTIETDFRFYPQRGTETGAKMRWVLCRANLIEFQAKEAILINTMDITRTKELEHMLRIQDKMTSLGRVATGIAHEIRNPLSGINIYLNTLEKLFQRGGDPEKIRGILEHIQSASRKIETVIKRVMDFSTPSAPQFVLKNINKSVEDAISLSSVSLRKRRIRIEKLLDDNMPECYIDPQLMEQVILNLITNAAESMKEADGENRIEITSSFENDHIIICVSDSGPGVPGEIRDKIFDPFYTTKSGSTGIGLSLCHRIVADHGGELDLTTSQWAGARFMIRIPVRKDHQQDD
ncbi:putative Histidine kinase [uncultured Desulfobacterium sp.]|uniref:histidine kinase n=1 Tax=uncultured Desulfobacterium sp. TaxID=201089 RepID=A0A445MYL9_9BACT|nr:putative Histidine kinase [uncultured Desulfobacterium sp.]